jgi:hypothetical protein
MKFKALALATTLALFFAVPFSRADSACAAGNIDYLLNAPCTIGNTESIDWTVYFLFSGMSCAISMLSR